MRVQGRVQGVGFRQATVRKAHSLGITGWVRNMEDGTVEAMIQGNPEQIDLMRQWLNFGPLLARVNSVDAQRIDTDRVFTHFQRQ